LEQNNELNKSNSNNGFKLVKFTYTPEQVVPKFEEKTGKKWTYYGSKNDYPLILIDLKYQSVTNKQIIDSIANQVLGGGFKIKDDVNDPKLQSFIHQCNSKGESLFDVFTKIVDDYITFGGWCTSVVWKKSKQNFELYHTDFSTIRSGHKDEKGNVNEYFFSENWKKSNSNVKEVPAFNVDKRSGTQLYYFKKYSQNNCYYPLPDWIACVDSILQEIKIGKYNNSFLDSGAFPSLAINFPGGVPSKEVQEENYENIVGNYAGAPVAGGVIVTYSEGKDEAPQIVPLSTSEDGKKFIDLLQEIRLQIACGHGITSPELIGIPIAGRLGNSSIIESQQLFFSKVIKPKQKDILKELNYLLKQNGFENEVEIIQEQPIEFSISEDTMTKVMTINEIREKIGLGPLSNGDRLIGSEETSTDQSKPNPDPPNPDPNAPDNPDNIPSTSTD
jgi:hypothetical protein